MRHGAVAVIISGDKILLFHRDNSPNIPFPNCWQLPGGGIEGDESPEEAIKRELAEEVTYVPNKLIPVGYYANKSGNNYVYIAFVTPEEEKQFKHKPEEGQAIGFFTLKEAEKLNLTTPLRWFLENKRAEIEEVVKTKLIPNPEEFEMKNI